VRVLVVLLKLDAKTPENESWKGSSGLCYVVVCGL
jgi:hypothetical protein